MLSSKKNDLRRLTKDVSIHCCLYATKSNCWKPVKLLYKMSKVCYKCKKEKVLEEFNKNKSEKDGLHRQCKDCRRNERLVNRQYNNDRNKEYYKKNKDILSEKSKKYREEHKEHIKVQRALYRNLNKEKIKIKNSEYIPIRLAKIKERRRNDIEFRIYEVYRAKFFRMLKGYNSSMKKYLMMTPNELISWISYQLPKQYSWENYGKDWHIDHVIPINKLDLTNENERKICYHWTNLQPLNKFENQSKSDKIELHHYMNQIIKVHRYIQNKQAHFNGYQAICESRLWLREKLGYGNNSIDGTIRNQQPSS